jgi:hypothetical protein
MFRRSTFFNAIFGTVTETLNNGLGGLNQLNPLCQIGGPRSAQFTLKVMF